MIKFHSNYFICIVYYSMTLTTFATQRHSRNFIAINKPQFRNYYLSAYHFKYLLHKKHSEKIKKKLKQELSGNLTFASCSKLFINGEY